MVLMVKMGGTLKNQSKISRKIVIYKLLYESQNAVTLRSLGNKEISEKFLKFSIDI